MEQPKMSKRYELMFTIRDENSDTINQIINLGEDDLSFLCKQFSQMLFFIIKLETLKDFKCQK